MRIYEAILLGFLQGLTEFLPVSSSGHLILFGRWLGVENGNLFFDVMLHIGTLVPVFIVFNRQIKGVLADKNRVFTLVLATIPAGLAGLLISNAIENIFYSGEIVGAVSLSFAFLFTATELFFAERIGKRQRLNREIGKKEGFIMGLAEAVAVVPGISRSGTVISAGTFLGVDREKNADFAFLMSIPIILASALFTGIKCAYVGIVIEVVPLLFGVLSAAVGGYLAIGIMLKVIKKANYKWFGIYLVVVAAVSLTEGLL